MLRLKPEDRWLLFFDLDGTIMEGIDDVRPEVLITFQKLRALGHQVFLATGRAPASIPPVYLRETDGCIALTGALGFLGSSVVFRTDLADSAILELAGMCEEQKIPVFLENEQYFSAFGKQEWFTGQDALFYPTANRFFQDTGAVKKAMESGTTFIKGCMGGEAYKRFTRLEKRLPEGITPVWAGDCVDLVPDGVDKGKAVRQIIRMLDVPYHRTICFGDSENDRELFRACAIRVAVGDPAARLREETSFRTGSVKEDGVVQAIKALGFLTP